MAEFIRATISSIHVGERLRPIDMDYAEAIAASMSEHGQISPIMIRKTPAKKGTPYTLVAGGYRTTAATLLGWTEIDAIVVKADVVEAQLLEISENLYRNELNALDRAIFVMKYRELWEEKLLAKTAEQLATGELTGLLEKAESNIIRPNFGGKKNDGEA